MRLGVVDYGARSPEQGSRVGSQRDQVTRGGARQSSSWLWAWQWTAIDVSLFVVRGDNERCKSWLLARIMIDTHTRVLTGGPSFRYSRYYHPVS